MGIKFLDKRADKSKVGYMGGRVLIGNPNLVVVGDLETRLAHIFKKTLEQAGYTVLPGAQPTLEGEIREFWVRGDGWSQGATEKIRLSLRDKEGQILWQQTFKGEDGGIDMAASFGEKSMNVALTRLLTDAMEEFTSESFYQAVRKATGGK